MKRIQVDTAAIEMDDSEIQYELDTDLQRMDKMEHSEAPKNADAYRVTVTPSTQSYMPGFHRFRFELQYGKMKGEEFMPLGKPARYQTETLPIG